MAGCPADLFDEQHDGVAVAIKPDGLHLLHMPPTCRLYATGTCGYAL